jgi:hypothetical protein
MRAICREYSLRVHLSISMSGLARLFVWIAWLAWMPAVQVFAAEEKPEKIENKVEVPAADPVVDPDDAQVAEDADAAEAAVARPVSPELVRVYGWREHIEIKGIREKLQAKLDTGALTSSIHAEEKQFFERDGKKWVRFLVKDKRKDHTISGRLEAPLVRVTKIKEPGGVSVEREVVLLSFRLGDRKFRGEFTLNNRSNMLAPILIGRSIIKDLGWVDVSRTHLADQNILR